ncbi:MAG TPA: glycoside hydrolase family 20 zincin-like fold domain-containing protein, partial [Verrucomicrobiae bacterium]|nr:glycoside hydrolase family 20 zincin-like fold domain-containing protein [Verrucomicrobiae bacterium]
MRANLFIISASLFAAAAFSAEPTTPAILPAPQKMEVKEGVFHLVPEIRIEADASSAATADYLAAKLRVSTGYPVPTEANGGQHPGSIQLTTSGAKAELGPEGYELDA